MASLIGKEIGKYRITERIGRGGMAEVYEGIHTHLDRKVAVKVLHSHLLEGGDFVARFKREAKAVANLLHPNIVQVYDFDIQDDLIFMVMQYIEGVNLHTKLAEAGKKGQRLPVKLIASIISDIAGALDYAHSRGMLHRDIKPSNIMIDQDNKAYLTDFGIAKLLDDPKFTATGQLIGTPAYMSPEQGQGEDLTKESDIYSLGVVAFEMLTGQVPYDAPTPIGVMLKQINDPVPSMSDLADDIPGTAQQVIDKALSKSPDSRYSSAEELVGALKIAMQALEALESVPVSILEDPPTVVDDGLDAPTVTMDTPETEQKTVVMEKQTKKDEPVKEKSKEKPAPKPNGDKKKIPVWVYIVGAVVLLGGIAIVLTQVLNINLPGNASGSIDPDTIEVYIEVDQTDQGITLINDDLDGDYKIVDVGRDQTFSTGNGMSFTAEDGNIVSDYYIYFDVQDTQIYGLAEESEITIIVTYLDQGRDGFYLDYDAHSGGDSGDGRFKMAGTIHKMDTKEFKTAQFTVFDAFFTNRNHGSDFRIGDRGDGAEFIRSVKVIYRPSDRIEHSTADDTADISSENADTSESLTGEELYDLAVEFCDLGHYQECIDLCYQALDAGYEWPSVYNQIGFALYKMGDFEAALETSDTAIELDPTFPWSFWTRGHVRFELGDLDGAIEDLKIGNDLSPNTHAFLFSLGNFYNESGQFEEALTYFDQALEAQPDNTYTRTMRADLLWNVRNDMEGALEDLSIVFENPSELSRYPYDIRGSIYEQTGQYELCISNYDEEYITRYPDHPWTFFTRGICYDKMGDNNAARQDYERFLELISGDPDLEEQRNLVQKWLDNLY
ncbi:MAG: protein kinase [Anaerolineales bacterium]